MDLSWPETSLKCPVTCVERVQISHAEGNLPVGVCVQEIYQYQSEPSAVVENTHTHKKKTT